MGLIEERHSARVFSDDPIPDDSLDDVLKAAGRAPSSCDRRGVSVKVVTGRDERALLGGLLVGGVGWIHRAPAVLLLMGDPRAYKAGNEISYMPYLDAGAALGQMYLAATAAGLRACFVNPNIREGNLEHFHDVFGNGVYCGALALGLPRDDSAPEWVWETS
jgi:nitroreductase